MGKLIFYYGTMDASKTSQLLQNAHRYDNTNKNFVTVLPKIADRDGEGVIKSRALPDERKADIVLKENQNIFETLAYSMNTDSVPDFILIDESQFLTSRQVLQLLEYRDEFNAIIICYGLLVDSNYNTFEGSHALFKYANERIEIKSACHYCHEDANAILRFDENESPIFDGEQVKIGGNESYKSVCSTCWFETKNKWSEE